MKNSKMDRRVKYTKTMLKNALVQLMQKQHISSISIKSLCDTADINRSTFYAHYSDSYDLLNHMEEEVMDNLRLHLEQQDNKDDSLLSAQVITSILGYAKENADLFKVLLSENCDFAFQRDVLVLSQIVSAQFYNLHDERMKEYLEAFGITGCISVFHKWLKDGMIESPETITEFILKVLYHGIASFQDKDSK